MSQPIANIWTFHTAHFAVSVDVYPEDRAPDDQIDDDETLLRIDNGTLEWFSVRATCTHLDSGCTGEDWLGGCCYESFDAFRDHLGIRAYARKVSAEAGHEVTVGSYFSDMVRAAVDECRNRLNSVCRQWC